MEAKNALISQKLPKPHKLSNNLFPFSFFTVLLGFSLLLDNDGDINKSSNTSDPYWPALVEDLLKDNRLILLRFC